jgi:hypothetical protein
VLAALAAFAGHAAVVYKWTDSDGVVHFSDQPVPGAQKIYTSSSAGAGAASAPHAAAATDNRPPDGQKQPPGLGYTQFTVTSPAPDQTFFGDELISVSLTLIPDLKQNHVVTWHLNGRQLDDQAPNATQFNLPRLDRGTYTIAATITDPQSGESQSTDSISFFVRQPSALSPTHQKP